MTLTINYYSFNFELKSIAIRKCEKFPNDSERLVMSNVNDIAKTRNNPSNTANQPNTALYNYDLGDR